MSQLRSRNPCYCKRRLAELPANGISGGTKRERAAFLRALRALDHALEDNIDRAKQMKERIAVLEEASASGRPLREIVPQEGAPLLVQMLTENAEVLADFGARVRRTEARVLYSEGMTMDQIAELFGVSRQRVSALVRGN
jgi:DNA-directed RNA polymerase sigma subunit (sigma70/sigma32)